MALKQQGPSILALFLFLLTTTTTTAFQLVRRPERSTPASFSLRRLSATPSAMDVGVPGRVSNITQWLEWSDTSLRRLAPDGRGGLYDRTNQTTAQQVHEHGRFAVLSHGNQTDPVYNYVNAAGLEVFGRPEHLFVQLPSRYSAPSGTLRTERAAVIDTTVAKDVQYIEEAVRVRYPTGTVTLRKAILWNVYDDQGYRVGQTVLFDEHLVSYNEDGEEHQ